MVSNYAWANILLTSAERGVLKDVGNTRVIWGVSLECNGEDIVLVVSSNVQIFCSGLLMLKLEGCKL